MINLGCPIHRSISSLKKKIKTKSPINLNYPPKIYSGVCTPTITSKFWLCSLSRFLFLIITTPLHIHQLFRCLCAQYNRVLLSHQHVVLNPNPDPMVSLRKNRVIRHVDTRFDRHDHAGAQSTRSVQVMAIVHIQTEVVAHVVRVELAVEVLPGKDRLEAVEKRMD